MGNCAASQYKRSGSNYLNWPDTAKIIHIDGRLEEFKQPIKAKNILHQNPNCFLCSSESMFIGSQVPRLPEDEELQLGQIYFLMPLSNSQATITLQELCSLAIKTSSAISHVTSRNGAKYPAGARHGCCEVPMGFQVPARKSDPRVEY